MTLAYPIPSALPDGTFLLVNGAKQGVAGFGLATDPNFQALLYDPTQPVGSRISILNETIVPRLYHSESTVRDRRGTESASVHADFDLGIDSCFPMAES